MIFPFAGSWIESKPRGCFGFSQLGRNNVSIPRWKSHVHVHELVTTLSSCNMEECVFGKEATALFERSFGWRLALGAAEVVDTNSRSH